MNIPAQDQTSNSSFQNAVIGNQSIEKKLQQFPKFKFSFWFVAVVVIMIVLGAILAFIIPSQNLTSPPQQTTTVANADRLPKKGLASANGQITAIFPKEEKVTVKSLSPRPNGSIKYWTVTITPETILAKFNDQPKVSPNESTISAVLPKTDTGIKTQPNKIGLNDFKIGDNVYLMAKQGQDLATMEEIEGPSALLLQ